MIHYKKMTVWQNLSAQKKLNEYVELVNDYFSKLIHIRSEPEYKKIKSRINKLAPIVSDLLYASDTMTGILFAGTSSSLNSVIDLMNFEDHRVSYTKTVNLVEMAIGKYEDDYKNSIIRTFNPFFWLVLLVGYIMDLPFILWGRVGFDRKKAESSFLGKVVKFIVALVAFLASVATLVFIIVQLFEKFGHLNTLKKFLGIE